jgi:ACR3 family arsenite efflux pump ArsB
MAAKRLALFERYLTLWVARCMAAGIALGKLLPGLTSSLSENAKRGPLFMGPRFDCTQA